MRKCLLAWAYVSPEQFYPINSSTSINQEFKLLIPNAQRMNRGNYVISQLVHACRANNITDLIIIHEHRGEPSKCVCVWVGGWVGTCVCRDDGTSLLQTPEKWKPL